MLHYGLSKTLLRTRKYHNSISLPLHSNTLSSAPCALGPFIWLWFKTVPKKLLLVKGNMKKTPLSFFWVCFWPMALHSDWPGIGISCIVLLCACFQCKACVAAAAAAQDAADCLMTMPSLMLEPLCLGWESLCKARYSWDFRWEQARYSGISFGTSELQWNFRWDFGRLWLTILIWPSCFN